MSIIDFMIKHPIITFLIMDGIVGTINNIVLYVTKMDKVYSRKTTNLEDFIEITTDIGGSIKRKLNEKKEEKEEIEIGFHSNK